MTYELKVNETTVLCHDCQKTLEPAEGMQLDYWTSTTFICTPCRQKRDDAIRARRQKEMRQGDVLTALVPAISKVGRIIRLDGGRDQYISQATVKTSYGLFTIRIEEQDASDEEGDD